ncbi:MAG: hydroxyacid dehydrogenase [Hyphomicrobiaceae bacterium]
MPTVLITERVHADAVALLEAEPGFDVVLGDEMEAAQFEEALTRADAIGVRVHRLGADVLARAPHLKVIAKHGVGTDNIDHAHCTARGIVVTNTPDANKISVAEHAMMAMLALAKRMSAWDGAVRSGLWQNAAVPLPYELAGRTLALVGFGRSARELARRARAFDMEIAVWSRSVDEAALAAVDGRRFERLEDAIAAADVVSVHVPRVAGAPPLISATEIGMMRRGALLVNCARGGIVDEAALAGALISGHVGGAGIDVFETEPLPAESLLRKAPNVIFSPHIAGVTDESLRRVGLEMARCIVDGLTGRIVADRVVNREVLSVRSSGA